MKVFLLTALLCAFYIFAHAQGGTNRGKNSSDTVSRSASDTSGIKTYIRVSNGSNGRGYRVFKKVGGTSYNPSLGYYTFLWNTGNDSAFSATGLNGGTYGMAAMFFNGRNAWNNAFTNSPFHLAGNNYNSITQNNNPFVTFVNNQFNTKSVYSSFTSNANGGDLVLTPNRVALSLTNPSAQTKGITMDNSQFTIADGINNKGMVYSADYSATGVLDPLWIPNWGAVKQLVSTGSGSSGSNGGVDTTAVHKAGSEAITGYKTFNAGFNSVADITINFLTVGKGRGHGDNNTALGYHSLIADSASVGTNNTAAGAFTLASNTTGHYNNAVGSGALYSNTTGSYNNAFGYAALFSNVSGNDNAAFGHNNLPFNVSGTGNSSFGADGLFNNTTGSFNVSIGLTSLQYNTTGSYNVSLGAFNMRNSNNTGSYNIALGAYVELPPGNNSGQLNIGNVLFGSGLYQGTTASSTPTVNGMIGIGTNTPLALFSVGSSSQFQVNSSGNLTTTQLSVNGRASGAAQPTTPNDFIRLRDLDSLSSVNTLSKGFIDSNFVQKDTSYHIVPGQSLISLVNSNGRAFTNANFKYNPGDNSISLGTVNLSGGVYANNDFYAGNNITARGYIQMEDEAGNTSSLLASTVVLGNQVRFAGYQFGQVWGYLDKFWHVGTFPQYSWLRADGSNLFTNGRINYNSRTLSFGSGLSVTTTVSGTDTVRTLTVLSGAVSALDTTAVHKTGNETIAGNKIFSGTTVVGTGTTKQTLDVIAPGNSDGLRLYSLNNSLGSGTNPPSIGFYQSIGAPFSSPVFQVVGGTYGNGFALSSPSSNLNWIVGDQAQGVNSGIRNTYVNNILGILQQTYFTSGTTVFGVDADAASGPLGGFIRSGAKSVQTTDGSGSDLAISGGGGTGASLVGGNLLFQTPDATASSQNRQNYTTKMQLQRSGNLTIGTTTDVPSSLLTLTSTSKGFLLPRMTAGQEAAIASPATGLQLFNTTTNAIDYYNGSNWTSLAVSGSSGTTDTTVLHKTGTETINGIKTFTAQLSANGGVAIANTLTNSSGIIPSIAVTPIYNQTGTAGGTDLLINRTETAVGSGSQYLIAGQVGGTNKFYVDHTGLTFSSAGFATLTGRIAVGSSAVGSALIYVTGGVNTSGSFNTSGMGGISVAPGTYTSTGSSGTISAAGINTFGVPTLAASSATTIGYASNLYIAGGPTAGTNVTINNASALYVASGNSYFGGNLTATGYLYTSFTGGFTNSNFGASPTNIITSQSNSALLFGGATSVGVRALFNGSNSSGILSGNSYANVIVGSAPVATATSGTHAVLANEVINPIGTVTSGGATVTNTASLYVNGNSAATVTGTNYGLWTKGNTRLDLGSDAAGDLFYRTSTGALARLPIGSSGQTLTVSGGVPAWGAASSGGIAGTPSIAAGSGAGTSPTVSVTSNGHSLQVTVTVGSSPSASATVASVTLATALSYTPYPTFSPANSTAAALSGSTMIFMTSTGSSNVTISSGSSSLPAGTYVWNIQL